MQKNKQYTAIRQFYAWVGFIAIIGVIAYALGFISIMFF